MRLGKRHTKAGGHGGGRGGAPKVLSSMILPPIPELALALLSLLCPLLFDAFGILGAGD